MTVTKTLGLTNSDLWRGHTAAAAGFFRLPAEVAPMRADIPCARYTAKERPTQLMLVRSPRIVHVQLSGLLFTSQMDLSSSLICLKFVRGEFESSRIFANSPHLILVEPFRRNSVNGQSHAQVNPGRCGEIGKHLG